MINYGLSILVIILIIIALDVYYTTRQGAVGSVTFLNAKKPAAAQANQAAKEKQAKKAVAQNKVVQARADKARDKYDKLAAVGDTLNNKLKSVVTKYGKVIGNKAEQTKLEKQMDKIEKQLDKNKNQTIKADDAADLAERRAAFVKAKAAEYKATAAWGKYQLAKDSGKSADTIKAEGAKALKLEMDAVKSKTESETLNASQDAVAALNPLGPQAQAQADSYVAMMKDYASNQTTL